MMANNEEKGIVSYVYMTKGIILDIFYKDIVLRHVNKEQTNHKSLIFLDFYASSCSFPIDQVGYA